MSTLESALIILAVVVVAGVVAAGIGVLAAHRLILSRRRGPPAWLIDAANVTGRESLELRADVVHLGRTSRRFAFGADSISIAVPTVGHRHATIEFRDGAYHVVDLGSVNGTRVNGERIDGSTVLRNGDVIGLESVELQFSQPFDSTSAENLSQLPTEVAPESLLAAYTRGAPMPPPPPHSRKSEVVETRKLSDLVSGEPEYPVIMSLLRMLDFIQRGLIDKLADWQSESSLILRDVPLDGDVQSQCAKTQLTRSQANVARALSQLVDAPLHPSLAAKNGPNDFYPLPHLMRRTTAPALPERDAPLAHRLDGPLDRRECGDDDHDLIGIVGANSLQHLDAGHVGQHQVQEDEIDLFFGQELQPRHRVGRAQRRVALLAQQGGQHLLQDLLVVDDQDAHGEPF